jgi:hypothetical protein
MTGDQTVNHQLNIIRPEIRFTCGSSVFTSKRCVRSYELNGIENGESRECLCISAWGKLWKITPTGPKTATCDMTAPALVDFGSMQKAHEDAQKVAPVVTLAKLGIKRPPRPNSKTACLEEEVSELRSQIAEMASTLDGYRNSSK